jgi:hypothetical protein
MFWRRARRSHDDRDTGGSSGHYAGVYGEAVERRMLCIDAEQIKAALRHHLDDDGRRGF